MVIYRRGKLALPEFGEFGIMSLKRYDPNQAHSAHKPTHAHEPMHGHNNDKHEHDHGHDHGHEHHKGPLARIVALFQHSHSHGAGPVRTSGVPGFPAQTGSGEAHGIGALTVEGPDDVGHMGDAAADAGNKASHHHTYHLQHPSKAIQYLGTPHTHTVEIATLTFASALTPLGLYTLFVSSQEAHEIKHLGQDLRKQIHSVQKKRDEIIALLKRKNISITPEARKNLTAQYIALTAFSPHLQFMLQQNTQGLRFWRSAQASGALLTTKGIINLAATSKASTSMVAATAGGIATTALSPLAAIAAMGVGGYFTASATAQQKYLSGITPIMRKQIQINRADRTLDEFRHFIGRKIVHRKRFNKHRVIGGSIFTGSSGLILAGSLVGGALGLALAPTTLGTSIPICTTVGAVLGGIGAAGSIGSVGILPYGHTKHARHQSYEQAGRTEDATLLAIADLQHPGSGMRLRAQELRETQAKFEALQHFLIKAACASKKHYTCKEHDSDVTRNMPNPSTAHASRFKRQHLEEILRNPNTFPSALAFMRKTLSLETQKYGYLSEKIKLRAELFKTSEPKDKNSQEIDIVLLDKVKHNTQRDAKKQQRAAIFLEKISTRNPEEAMRNFLELQTGQLLQTQKKDVYRQFAEYCFTGALKQDRAARGAIFESQVWAAQVAQAAKEAGIDFSNISVSVKKKRSPHVHQPLPSYTHSTLHEPTSYEKTSAPKKQRSLER
jgi:hypothetical protein